MGPSFLGVKKEKVCYRATSSGFEHGAFGSKSLTFTPEPIAPGWIHRVSIQLADCFLDHFSEYFSSTLVVLFFYFWQMITWWFVSWCRGLHPPGGKVGYVPCCELGTDLRMDCPSDCHLNYAGIFAVKVRFQIRDQFGFPGPNYTGQSTYLIFFAKPQNGLVGLLFEKRCFRGGFRDKIGLLSSNRFLVSRKYTMSVILVRWMLLSKILNRVLDLRS